MYVSLIINVKLTDNCITEPNDTKSIKKITKFKTFLHLISHYIYIYFVSLILNLTFILLPIKNN